MRQIHLINESGDDKSQIQEYIARTRKGIQHVAFGTPSPAPHYPTAKAIATTYYEQFPSGTT